MSWAARWIGWCFYMIATSSTIAWRVRRSVPLLRSFARGSDGNHFPGFSTTLKAPILGEKVLLVNGEVGELIASGRGGWFSVQISRTKEIISVRRTDITSFGDLGLLRESSDIVTIDETPSKEHFPPILQLDPPTIHKDFKRWIIFSDLHVKASSIETCEQVLHEVNECARQRNAGIIFLGDFWHIRGALSVDLLNRVLKSLQRWSQPVIMIPGNHDQVTLGGKIHALEPLRYAFQEKNILMIDEPSICLNALWLPYRRNHHLMKHILTEAWNHSDISAVFCHADVKGAWMNDGLQSREGVDIQLFPPNIPIFSGHFHKPHSVAFSQQSLRYVGSPYQTSLSEADQIKYLYEVSLLDRDSNARAHKWKETDRWPIQIGKRYFKIDYNQLSSKLDGVSSGDTVILQAELKHQQEVDVAARELRDKGVEVEVREPQKDKLFIKSLLENSSTLHVPSMLSTSEIVEMQDASANDNNINSNNNMLPQESEQFPVISLDMDHMSPVTLFENYMNHVELTQVKPIADNATKLGNSENQEIAAAIQSKVVEEGKQVIERLMHQHQANSEHAGGGTETLGTMNSEHRHLLLDSIKLRNFGPFGGAPVEYPLTKRGLVLLRGQAMDQTGADSNGSGKTTLAMSILWALTGSLDTRLSNEGRSYDVAFDVGPHAPTVAKRYSSSLQRSTAEVSLKGHINGKPFEVIRRKSNKKQELFFFVDGQELTNQAVKDTQAVMDAWLGLDRGVLQRCFFFGQHSHTSQSLLGLTDGKMKEELSPLINIDIWTASSSDCRSREKAIKGELADTNVSLKFATQTEYPRLVEQIQAQETKCRQLEEEFHQLLQSRPTLGGGIGVVGASSSSSSSSSSSLSSSGDQHRQAMFDSKQLQELQDVVAQLERRKEELHRGRLAPLRSELVQIVNNQADFAMATEEEDNATTVFGAHNATTTAATQLKALQMQASRVKAAQELTATNVRRLKDKIETELIPTKNQLQSTMERMLSGDDSIAAEWASMASSSDHDDTRHSMDMLRLEDAFREKQEASISHLAALDEQLRVINGTLQRLAVPPPGATAPKGMVDELTAHVHAHAQQLHDQHDDENGDMCPTCNQTFPMESRIHRQRILRHELQVLLSARVEQLRRQRSVQEQLATVKALVELDRQYRSLSKDEDDARRQWTSLTGDLHQGASQESQLQVEIDALQRRERDARQRFQRRVASLQRDIAEAEHEFHGLDADVLAKKQQIQQQQRWFDRWKEQEGRYNVSVHLLEEKGRLARRTVLELQEQLERTQQSVDRLEARRRDLLHRSQILSYLTDFFGPKGIQHYIFQSVIERLEYLANTYLAFLTNDGIRLQLRSDADGEKILKYVLVRHSSDIDAAIAVSSPSSSSSSSSSSLSPSSSPSSPDLETSTNTNANNNYNYNYNHNNSRGKSDDDAIRIPGGFRERGLAQLSGGQWRRVSLALDFAFTELVIRRGLLKCNVLVLDEILTHLDGQGREAVGSVLKAMVDRTSPATTTQPLPPQQQHHDNDAVVASDASTSPPVFGGGFETIIVILQDLAANEIEEAFDHIDLVRKDGDISKVIVDV